MGQLERETCKRCGGSGKYSWNQMDGNRCYGCGGRGNNLTARGSKAYDYLFELLSKEAKDLVVGDSIKMGVQFMPTSFLVIVSIKEDDLNEGITCIKCIQKNGNGETFGMGIRDMSKRFRVMKTADEKKAALKLALEYQNSL